LGQAEIIVDDNKSIWFIDRANKFWYLELRSSGALWWRYSFFNDFFPLFGMERKEYEPVIAEWVEEVLKCNVSSFGDYNVLNPNVMEEVLKREVSSTLQSKIAYQNQVEEVLNRKVNSTQRNHMNDCDELEEALKLGVSSFLNFDTPRNREVGRALKRKVNSTDAKYILPHWELEKVLQIKIQPEETNLKRVLSLKAGVRECKMKIKKILKKIMS
jgi:hypothetical protein